MTATPPRNGFDGFIKLVLLCLVACLGLVVCLTSCNPAARQCRKAEAKLADAIHLCPSIMLPEVRVDTVTIYTKPEAGTGGRLYTQYSVDSLFRMFRDGLSAANKADTVEVVRRIVQRVCYFDTITVADSALLLKIWPENGRVRYWYNVLPQRVRAVVTTPTRTIAASPCPPVSRVRSWAWLWSIPAFALGIFIGLFFKGSHRNP